MTPRTWRSRIVDATGAVRQGAPSALRAVSIGSVFEDLSDEWERLLDPEKRRVQQVMRIGSTLLASGAVLLALATLFDWGGTNVVHVFARTEHVTYTPLRNDPPQWLLEDVRLLNAGIDPGAVTLDLFGGGKRAAPDPVVHERFSGFFQPRCGDAIVVSRVGRGELRVAVRSFGDAQITDRLDRTADFGEKTLGRAFTILSPVHGEKEARPAPVLWPLEGRIDPSRAVGPRTHSSQGLLLEGKVEVTAGRLFDFTYPADEHVLELGDQIVLPVAKELRKIDERLERRRAVPPDDGDPNDADPDEPSVSALCEAFDESGAAEITDKGFIHLDERAGMNVSVSSNARHAEILRYRTTPIRVENNWFKRVVNDPFLSIGWTLLGVFFFLYRRVARWLVSSYARRRREPGTPTS